MTSRTQAQSTGSKQTYTSLNRESLRGCFAKVKSATESRPVELRGPFLNVRKRSSN